jgi:SAM-dependent methyltransferase
MTHSIREDACSACPYFDENKADCSIGGSSPIRKCVIAINRDIVKEISSRPGNFSLLEIGCGRWSYLKDNLPANLRWEGIDVFSEDRLGRKTIATRLGSVEKIPFENGSFDYVLANQSIEHWFEFGVTFKKALSEIARVLKTGGVFMVNFPIHLHGHLIFAVGREKEILGLFPEKNWEIVKIEKWRKNPFPLDRYQPWKNKTSFFGREYENETAWIMNLVLKKKEGVKLGFKDNFFYRASKFFNYFLPARAKLFFNYGPGRSFRMALKKFKKSPAIE